MEDAGRRYLASCSEHERAWAPRRCSESYVRRMHEVEVLRLPPAFARTQPGVALLEGGAVARTDQKGGSFAATKAVMRAGRHFAQVTLGAGLLLFFGIVRPDWEGSQMPAGMREKPVALLRSFYSLALLAASDP